MVAGNTAAFAPGKRSLVEKLQASLRPGGGSNHAARPRQGAHFGSTAPSVAAGTAHRAPPPRVAGSAAEPNAVLRVVVYDAAGAVIQRWESRGRWEGGLPQTYTATRAGKGWSWDNTGGSSIRVNTDQDGRGGAPLEAWAKATAKTIVVYAYAIEDVTIDDGAAASDKAPGHAREPQQGRGGAAPERVAPASKGAGGDHRTGHRRRSARCRSAGGPARRRARPAPVSRRASKAATASIPRQKRPLRPSLAPKRMTGSPTRSSATSDHPDEDLEDGSTSETTGDGPKPGGKSPPCRDVDGRGRTGEDTRLGGTGPGGDRARPDEQGKGFDAGGKDGSEGGSKDGQHGGVVGGMYGGEGKAGDDGVPSGVALFGGLIGIPAALKGLVEVALIIADGNITGAGAGLFRKGLGQIASAAAARKMIASEARRAAVKELTAAIDAIKADRVRGSVWKAATKAEREAATRRIYWELQRTYFDAYQKAAKQAKREARAALDKSAGDLAAQQKLTHAELAEEATNVKPIAGRLPPNHKYAGHDFPNELLPPKYRKKGVRFSKEGHPDFAPHARELPNGKNYVEIEYTGSRRADEALANKKAKLAEIPDGWTWHHAEDMKTMYLVPTDLHEAVKHSGGAAKYKHASGVSKYGD